MTPNWIQALSFDLNWHMVAFIGGGGKTTTIENLASELLAQGKKVLITTTTKIWYPHNPCYDVVLRETTAVSQSFVHELSKHCKENVVVVSGEGVDENGKIVGHTLEALDEISRFGGFDVILVEADGSKGKSLKAHAAHEPQIPSHLDFCYVVTGADILGKPVNDQFVHRANLFSARAGVVLNEVITIEKLAEFYNKPGGYKELIPDGCPSAWVWTKVSSLARYDQVKQLAKVVQPDVSVMMAPVLPKSEKHHYGIRGVLLAAGSASRFGGGKLTHEILGKSFVEWTVGMLLATELDEIVVVYKDPLVKQILLQHFSEPWETGRLIFALNERAEEGQSTSLKVGVLTPSMDVQNGETSVLKGYMFFMADQLLLEENTVGKLIRAFEPGNIITPVCHGKTGAPVIFSTDFLEELLSVVGDKGGRDIIMRHQDLVIQVDVSEESLFDVDTREDLNEMINMMERW